MSNQAIQNFPTETLIELCQHYHGYHIGVKLNNLKF